MWHAMYACQFTALDQLFDEGGKPLFACTYGLDEDD